MPYQRFSDFMENHVRVASRRNSHCLLNTISTNEQEQHQRVKRCSSSPSKQPPTLNNSKLSTLHFQTSSSQGDTKNHQCLIKSVQQNAVRNLVKEHREMTKFQKPEYPFYLTAQNVVEEVKSTSHSNFRNSDSTLTLPEVKYVSEEMTTPPSSSSYISLTESLLLSDPVGNQLSAKVNEEVYYQMKQLQQVTHHIEKLGEMVRNTK